jgi:hypothetical protein
MVRMVVEIKVMVRIEELVQVDATDLIAGKDMPTPNVWRAPGQMTNLEIGLGVQRYIGTRPIYKRKQIGHP